MMEERVVEAEQQVAKARKSQVQNLFLSGQAFLLELDDATAN